MTAFEKVGERVLHRGAIITVVDATFRAPDGQEFHRDVVQHPGAVSVVPLLDDGRVVMVRQYRAALGRDLLEIPAGKRDVAGEPPELTAIREVQEEVGYIPTDLQLLAEFFNTPGFCDEHSFVFLGTKLVEAPPSAQGVEEGHMTIEHHHLDDVAELIRTGELVDGKSIIGLMLAREALGG